MSGILTAQEIIAAIDEGNLIAGASKDAVEACSYDLSIGTIFHRGQVIGESHPDARTQIIIQPGEIISMFTKEELNLPADICATVFPLNSQSSKGLLVLNPGHIDPGFRGPVSVKALNLRKAPLAISLGMEIFTIIFERLPLATTRPYSKNTPRAKREMAYNANDVEVSPRSLSALISFGSDSPYPTVHQVADQIAKAPYLNAERVREEVRNHWMSVAAFWLSMLATAFAVIAVLQSTFGRGSSSSAAPLVQIVNPTPIPPAPPAVVGSPSSKSADGTPASPGKKKQ